MENHTFPHLTLNATGVRSNSDPCVHVEIIVGTLENHWGTMLSRIPAWDCELRSENGLRPDTKILHFSENL